MISTINGSPQLALLEAAAAAQVRHFIPSGFSGPEQCASQCITGTDWQDLVDRLRFHDEKSNMRYTIFTCGVFYENFGPGGLNAMQISTFNNKHASIGEEGDLLVDFRAGRATVPVAPITYFEDAAICMTSARDVARYVVATLQAYEELSLWPREFKFCTERFTVTELVDLCERVRGESNRLCEPITYKYSSGLKHVEWSFNGAVHVRSDKLSWSTPSRCLMNRWELQAARCLVQRADACAIGTVDQCMPGTFLTARAWYRATSILC